MSYRFSLFALKAFPAACVGLLTVSYGKKLYLKLTQPPPGFGLDENPIVFMDVECNGVELGRIVYELRSDVVPRTAENFRALCTQEHSIGYRNTKLFRIVPGFCVQGGDITMENGLGGRSIYGHFFEDESFELKHFCGALSMANSGPGTNNSQFVIVTAAAGAPWLDKSHVVFGRVVHGMQVVRAIEAFGTPSGLPSEVVSIVDAGELEQSECERLGLRNAIKKKEGCDIGVLNISSREVSEVAVGVSEVVDQVAD